MRRILLSCAILGLALLPPAASARADRHAGAGFVVVRNGAGDGGVNGRPVVTVVVHGFVLGSVKPQAEARVDIFHLPSTNSEGGPQAKGPPDMTRTAVHWRSPTGHVFNGTRFSGSGFRFSAIDGFYRVVVRGAGVYVFAGGHGNVTLLGSSVNRRADGVYSLNGRRWRSLPARALTRKIGPG